MKTKEIKDLTAEELKLKLKDRKKELMDLKIKLQMKSLENTAQINTAKKDVAKMLTLLKQKGVKL
jgi:large subunit ribosomal protein L29